jgi:hypothetical protein
MSIEPGTAEALAEVTRARLERIFHQQRQCRAELGRHHAEIDEIDRIRNEARNRSGPVTVSARIGADTLWQDWLLQRRAALLRAVALDRAREAELRNRARQAFARNEAAVELAERERACREAERAAVRQARLEETMILRALAAGSFG